MNKSIIRNKIKGSARGLNFGFMFTPVTPPYLIRRYYNKFTWNLPNEQRKVYLTFDDGPLPGVTDFVLDTLESFNAKATFFCVGDNVTKHAAIYNRILKNGHRTGNHTFFHRNGWQSSLQEYLHEVTLASKVISSDLFRPPYGRIKKSQSQEILRDYRIIMWDVLSYDFAQTVSPMQCLSNVKTFSRPGSIIVFHDNQKSFRNLREVLPAYLKYLHENNFVPAIIP